MKVEIPVFARNRQKHHKFPKLWDKTGRPIMAVAEADEFLECQELHNNPMSAKDWYNASMNAARRGYKSNNSDACVEWYTLAVRCLKRSYCLSMPEWVEPVGEVACLVGIVALAMLAMAVI